MLIPHSKVSPTSRVVLKFHVNTIRITASSSNYQLFQLTEFYPNKLDMNLKPKTFWAIAPIFKAVVHAFNFNSNRFSLRNFSPPGRRSKIDPWRFWNFTTIFRIIAQKFFAILASINRAALSWFKNWFFFWKKKQV